MQLMFKGEIINKDCSLNYILEKIHSLKHFDHHEVVIKLDKATGTLGLLAYKKGYGGTIRIVDCTEDERQAIIKSADAYAEYESRKQTIIFDNRSYKIAIPI